MNNTFPHRLETPKTTTLIYDAATGEIIHSHHVVVLPRAKSPSDEKIEADALSLATQYSQRDVTSLKALRVESGEFQNGVTYKVNPKTSKLEKVEEVPPRNRRKRAM